MKKIKTHLEFMGVFCLTFSLRIIFGALI